MPRPSFTDNIDFGVAKLPPELDQSALALEAKRYNSSADWYSDETQKVANLLPEWMEIRRVKQSNGQALLNAMYGQGISEVRKGTEEGMRRKFLSMIGSDYPDVVKRVTLPGNSDLAPPPGISNLCRNSYFQLWSYQHRMPNYWQVSAVSSVTVEVSSTSLLGHNAMHLSLGSSTTTATLFQDLYISLKASEKWTASVFYNITSNALTAPASDFGIQVIGYHLDGTTTTKQAVFAATTEGQWTRLALSDSFSKPVSKVRLQVHIKDDGGFAFSGEDIYLDCFQFERGSQVSDWIAREDDKLPNTDRSVGSLVFVGGSDSATQVDSEADFWYNVTPTRCSLLATLSETKAAVTSGGRYSNTDFFGKTYFYEYFVNGAQLRYRDIDHTDDYVNDFYLAFRDHDGFYKIQSTDVTVESLTEFGDFLWICGVFPDFRGNDKRILMCVRPRFAWPAATPAYLEVISAVVLPTPATSTAVTRIEFRQEDRQHIYVYSASNLYIYRLKYDAFIVDTAEGSLFLREDYSQVSVF